MSGKPYIVDSVEANGDSLTGIISLLPDHIVFQGHFPDNPVLPGVYMLEIVKDCLLQSEYKYQEIKGSKVLKFLIPIIPENNPTLRIEISLGGPDGSEISATSFVNSNEAHFKMKGTLG